MSPIDICPHHLELVLDGPVMVYTRLQALHIEDDRIDLHRVKGSARRVGAELHLASRPRHRSRDAASGAQQRVESLPLNSVPQEVTARTTRTRQCVEIAKAVWDR